MRRGGWFYVVLDDLVLVRVGGGRGARRDPELVEDVAHVPRDGLLADHELGSDRAVGLAGREQDQNLDLARSQAAGNTGIVHARNALQASEIGRGSKVRERRARGVELHIRTFVVREGSVRESDEQTHARGFVWSIELAPGR